MTVEEMKQGYAKAYGIPAVLLTGSTAEEIQAQADDLLLYRQQLNADNPKDTRQSFAAWLGTTHPTEYSATYDTTEATAPPAYPTIKNGGNANYEYTESRTPLEAFREWFYNKSAWDPARENGWKRLI